MALSYADREATRAREFEDIWTNQLGAAFSHIAAYYDRANSVASLGLWNRWRREFLDSVAVSPGQKVLDVCAGTNAIGIGLLDREPSLQIKAIDRSAAMQGVGKLAAYKSGHQIESVIADVHRLPFPDETFDVVTLEAASRHLRVFTVFSEIRRVLKPGGVFYHCDMLRPKSKMVENLYCAYLSACLQMTGVVFRSSADAWGCRNYFVKAIRMFYTSNEISELLSEAGFDDIGSRDILGGMVAFHRAEKAIS